MPSDVGRRRRRIAVGGDALVDIVTYADGRVEESAGGGPFNSARTMARLGADVSFCGTLSSDGHGTLLAAELADDGVDLSLTRRSERPTPLARATLDAHGNASYVFEFDGTAALDYPVAERPTLDGFAAFHVGTLGLVLEPMASTYRAMVADVDDEVLVVTDPNCRPQIIRDRNAYVASLAPVFARADVVKVSTDDLAYLMPGVDRVDAAARLLEQGAHVVILTAGAEGATVLIPGGAVHVPAPMVEVVDTIGAGDALGGAFTAWWVLNDLGRDELTDLGVLRAAVEAATAVAALTCRQVGANPPNRSELAAGWLDHHS